MTWLTWRLQRTEFLLLGGLILALSAMLIRTHSEIVVRMTPYTASTCPVPLSGPELGCNVPVGRLYEFVMGWLPWINVLPSLAALLIVVPVLSEIEKGTYRLAWTQGRTRGAWARARFGYVTLFGMAFAAFFSAIFHWWSSPMDPDGKLGRVWYDMRGTLPVGHTLFAIGLILAIGVLLKRHVFAFALASMIYVAVRLPIGLWLRPHLVAPVVQSDADWAESSVNNAWIISDFWRDADGNRISWTERIVICPTGLGRNATWDCLVDNKLTHYVVYHPESHYWPLQLTETAIYLALGLVLMGFASWYVVRRVE